MVWYLLPFRSHFLPILITFPSSFPPHPNHSLVWLTVWLIPVEFSSHSSNVSFSMKTSLNLLNVSIPHLIWALVSCNINAFGSLSIRICASWGKGLYFSSHYREMTKEKVKLMTSTMEYVLAFSLYSSGQGR